MATLRCGAWRCGRAEVVEWLAGLDDIESAFRALDVNGDGVISADELSACASPTGAAPDTRPWRSQQAVPCRFGFLEYPSGIAPGTLTVRNTPPRVVFA